MSRAASLVLFLFTPPLAIACGGGGTSTDTSGARGTSAGSSDVGVEGRGDGVHRPDDAVLHTATVTEPSEPGEEGCTTADECTLTDWRCSPCDTCPNVRTRALLVASLESARAACEWTSYTGPEPECEPCPDPDPDFRQWTSVACIDSRCVAHALGPTDAEALSDEPPSR